jgi:hypothetical protein
MAWLVVLLLLLGSPAWARTYQTYFPATENPLSEGGQWITGQTTGVDFTNVAVNANGAYGLQTGTAGIPQRYADSTAVLGGTWGAAQSAYGVVRAINASGGGSISEEVEIRLRTTITAHSITGYECNYSTRTGNGYAQIIRWNGALGDFTALDSRTISPVVTGDVVKCTISGSTISTYVNGTLIFSFVDATFATGAPGLGFYFQTDGTDSPLTTDYGFSQFLATDGTIREAATCGSSDVQTALNAAVAGDVVHIPSGSCTWNSSVTWTAPANVTVIGATTCTGAGQTLTCSDHTTLVNGSARLLTFTLPATGNFRMTGLTYTSVASPGCGSGASVTDHPIEFGSTGSNVYAAMRLDHSDFINVCLNNFEMTNVSGVADHNRYYNVGGLAGNNQVRPMGHDDDVEWTHPTHFGTSDYNWFYLEDSRWDYGISNDCFTSGRQVFRYNYMSGSGIQEHGTGHSGENRGCRALEVYGNSISGDNQSNHTTPVSLYSGSARVWGNAYDFTVATCDAAGHPTLGSCGGTNGPDALHIVEDRQSDYTYTQGPTPGDTGYCGTQFNGTGSVWDGNQDVSGYPCLDQVGRGPGDLLSGVYPTKRNDTRNCTVNFTWANRGANCDGSDSSANPRQALEPVYEWLNTGTVGNQGLWDNVVRDPGSGGGGTSNIIKNRDYYTDHGNTNCNQGAGSCTAGVGSGTRAQRPANCTTGVAWWSTDQGGNWNTSNGTANDGTLDICTATNTWTNAAYTPYTYPHPLQGAAAPAPPPPGTGAGRFRVRY